MSAAADRPPFPGVADAQLRSDVREYLAVYGCARALTAAVVAVGDTVEELRRRRYCPP